MDIWLIIGILIFVLPIAIVSWILAGIKTGEKDKWTLALIVGVLFAGIGILGFASFGRMFLPPGIEIVLFSIVKQFSKSPKL